MPLHFASFLLKFGVVATYSFSLVPNTVCATKHGQGAFFHFVLDALAKSCSEVPLSIVMAMNEHPS